MTNKGGQYVDWEWHQQNLKNGSLYYSSQCKEIDLAHIFFREFPTDDNREGAISHKIIIRNPERDDEQEKFLFSKIGRYENWNQCIHPMYYDHGGGGEHHSVTGMGVKLWAAMELQNRILCKLADDVFAPSMIFKATTAAMKQKLLMKRFGNYRTIPPECDLVQTRIAGFMQDGVAFNREVSGIVASNLSQYRQNLERTEGNPATASEINWRASQQSKLGKTQLNRNYDQCDYLYAEKFRRATNPKLTKAHPGGAMALEFQKRCKDRGVPLEVLRKMKVKATRIVGQGSLYERQQSLQFMMGTISMLPEDGRDNLMRMITAAWLGQHSVESIYPRRVTQQRPNDQQVEALQSVAAMKEGITIPPTSSQNAVIYAQTYIAAASQALKSIPQGGEPAEVLRFLETIGLVIAAQLKRIEQDPSRKQIYDVLNKQYEGIASSTDQLKDAIAQQQQMQQDQAAQQQQQEMMAQQGMDIDTAKAQHKMQLDEVKTESKLDINRRKSAQDMALKDLMSAHDMRLQALESKNETTRD
jgi:hypothetical protein